MKVSRIRALCIVLFASIASVALAETAEAEKPSKSKRDMIIEKMGGYVQRPDLKSGKVVFVNAQKRVKGEEINAVVDSLNRAIHTKMTVETSEGVALNTIKSDMTKRGATVAVFVIESNECENISLISPEGHWAIVNVAALGADGVGDVFVSARTRKEIVRTFTTLLGATASNYNEDLLLPISKIGDLDKISNEKPPMDVMGRVRKHLDLLEIETRQDATYLVACKEGWAPSPTNDIQRAIWEKINAKPANPIKIRPGDKPAK